VAGGASGVPPLLSPAVAEGVVIRPERDADHPVIAEVVRAAFVGHPDEVASFVARIRASEQFIPGRMNSAIPCLPSSTSRPSNWPVTPEVAAFVVGCRHLFRCSSSRRGAGPLSNAR
jgi:hypothetical protein